MEYNNENLEHKNVLTTLGAGMAIVSNIFSVNRGETSF